MPRANPLLESFNAGEFSGNLATRLSFQKYPFGAAIMRNMLPLIEGGMSRRPGTRYVAEAGDSSAAAWLLPFVFSTTQAYIIEAQDSQFRFYRNQGQITAEDIGASITNGTFDSDITDWDDNSTGAASIAWKLLGAVDEGTWGVTPTGEFLAGDAQALSKHIGLQFINAGAGDVTQVRIKTGTTHVTADNWVAQIYTDSSGSPGTQVESDSDAVSVNAASTEFTFTWSSGAPTLSASTTYWLVMSNTGTTGDTSFELIPDQGASWASGREDTITSISDGSGSFPAGDVRAEILVDSGAMTTGALNLKGSSGETASAEQDVTTTTTDTEHIIQFRVRGVAGDTIKFKVGGTTGGSDILAAAELGVGYHSIAFTPDVSPFYIQFDNERAKDVYIDNVSLIDNTPLELVTPYATADLPALKTAQSADVMYVTHRGYPVYKLSRSGHTTWSFEEVLFTDGPYLPANDTTTTLTPSAATGLGITLTFSSTTGVNDDAGLSASDVGRLVRYKKTSAWGYAIITSIESSTVANADVLGDFESSPTAQTTWHLGAWSAQTGYPSAATIFEQRLTFAASNDQPQTFWASQSADYENMTPDDGSGTVEDDDALNFTIGGTQVNAIRWISGGQFLFIGTNGGEWLVKSSGSVLTPTDIDVKQHTTHGSADIQAVQAGHARLFVHAASRKIQELVFDDAIQGLRSPDLSVLAPHALESGVTQIAYQEEPAHTLWCVRNDGQLAALAYERDENVVGWSRHIMGGSFSSGDPVVESVAVIPGNDGAGQVMSSEDRDEVWLVVKRTINGGTKRYIEFMEGAFTGPLRDDYATDALYETQLLSDQKDAFYVDSGLTYDGVATTTITGLDHLEGETVAVWADGKEQTSQTVSSGQITITSASKVQVGLPYTHAWKSLKNAAGSARGAPFGQRSRIHKVSLIALESLSGQIGPKQSVLHDIVYPAALSGSTKPLFTGELEIDDFDGDWDSDPRMFIQDSAPAPMTVTGIVPRVTVNEL